jgi:hypothetical protein
MQLSTWKMVPDVGFEPTTYRLQNVPYLRRFILLIQLLIS